MKSYLKLTFFLLIILVGIYTIPQYMTFNEKKNTIISTFTNYTNLSLEINGDIGLQLLPAPKLIINNAIIKNSDEEKIEVTKLILMTSYSSLFSNTISITGLGLENSSINLSNLKIFQNYSNTSTPTNQLKINEIDLVNLDFIINPEADLLNKIGKITGKLKFNFNENKTLSFKGNFNINNIPYTLNVNLISNKNANDNSSSIELYNDFLNFNFSGSYKDHNGYDINGKAILKIKPSKTPPPSDQSAVFSAMLTENIELKSDLTLNQGQINLENINFTSASINKALGQLSIIFGYNDELNIDLDFDQISLDNFFEKIKAIDETTVKKFTLDKFIKSFLNLFNYDLPDNINGDISLKIRNILFNKKNIENLIMDISVFEGKFIISNASVKLPGNTDLLLNGSLNHNDIRSKFQGKIDLKIGKLKDIMEWFNTPIEIPENSDFQKVILQSDVAAIPRYLNMENTKIAWGNVRLVGKSYIKNTGDKKLTAKITARIDKVDANELNIPQNIDEFLFKMFAYDIDKSGTKFLDAANDFKWLRTFPINLIGELLIDNAIYKKVNLQNFYSNFRIISNTFALDRIDFNTPNADFDASFTLQVSGLDPKIIANLNFNRLNENFFSDMFPNRKQFEEAFTKINRVEPITTIKEDVPKTNSKDKTLKDTPKPIAPVFEELIMPGFNFFSMDNFNGEINLKVNSFESAGLSFENLDLKTTLNEGVMGIQNLSADIFNGKAQIIGNIIFLTKIPNFNLSFALNNFDPAMLLNLYGGYSNITGYMSMNGNVVSSGIDLPSAINRATGNFKMVGKKITWKSFDIGEIIKLSEAKLALTEKIDRMKYYSANGESVFDEVDGTIEIGGGIASLKDCNLSNLRIKGAYVASVDLWNKLINGAGKISFIPYGTTSPILLTIGNSGKFNGQVFQFDSAQLVKFFNQQARLTEVNPEEERAKALLRNRKL